MRHMRLPGAWAQAGWLADVSMDNGHLARPWVSSLGAFWPGMQVLAGGFTTLLHQPLHKQEAHVTRQSSGRFGVLGGQSPGMEMVPHPITTIRSLSIQVVTCSAALAERLRRQPAKLMGKPARVQISQAAICELCSTF
jgi:hypothetical protein